jgi:hypothetical protein
VGTSDRPRGDGESRCGGPSQPHRDAVSGSGVRELTTVPVAVARAAWAQA